MDHYLLELERAEQEKLSLPEAAAEAAQAAGPDPKIIVLQNVKAKKAIAASIEEEKQNPAVDPSLIIPTEPKESKQTTGEESSKKKPGILRLEDLNAEDPPLSGKNVLDRIRAKPVVLVMPGAGLMFALIIVWYALGSNGSASVPPPPVMPPEVPKMEMPKVREEPYSLEEVRLFSREAERKLKKKEQEIPVLQVNQPKEKAATRAEAGPKAIQINQEVEKPRANRRVAKNNPAASPKKEAIQPVSSPELSPSLTSKRRSLPAEAYAPGVVGAKKEKSARTRGEPEAAPEGAMFSAKLQVGISTDFPSATVLAQVTEPLIKDGEAFLPKGSTVFGSMNGANGRIFINFNRATRPDGSKLSFKGFAVTGKLPGIPAKEIEREKSSGDGSAVTRGVVNTARGVAATLGGTVVHELAKNVASESLSDAQRGTIRQSLPTLELGAGTSFMVIVTGAD